MSINKLSKRVCVSTTTALSKFDDYFIAKYFFKKDMKQKKLVLRRTKKQAR